MKVFILGLGMIGGSIAKALKRSTDAAVYAMDRSEETLLDAVSMGAIDGKASLYDIGEMDLIYLCLYPQDCIDFMKKNAGYIRKGAIVTDACGVKAPLCEVLPGIAKANGFYYVAGHPMAGKEKSGFKHSDPSIFSGAAYILADSGAPQAAVREVENLAIAMGFGQIVHTHARHHDQMIAFTSQLPHVLACAYVMSPRCRDHQGFSAGSYRDVSRVADINAALWTRLFLDNRPALLEELDTLIGLLCRYRQAIGTQDEERLKAMLETACEIKRSDSK